jgi:hypothetical protein
MAGILTTPAAKKRLRPYAQEMPSNEYDEDTPFRRILTQTVFSIYSRMAVSPCLSILAENVKEPVYIESEPTDPTT